jgi:hypothetical protein
MANFPTHIAVGTIVSGSLATVTVAANMVAPENIIAVTLAGMLGSVLPDIDLKDSRPARVMFNGLAVFFSFAVLFSVAHKYSIAEMLILWLGTLLTVRFVGKETFARFSYHRGVWHSLLAMVFCAVVTACVFKYLLGKNDSVAWLAAGFLAIGYLTHLVLDEIYSVDVMDTRIKASFGTAVKLYDGRRLDHSAAMAVATVLVFLIAPSVRGISTDLTTPGLWSNLQQRLLPQDQWFRGKARMTASGGKADAAPSTSTSPIETGSILTPADAPKAQAPEQK